MATFPTAEAFDRMMAPQDLRAGQCDFHGTRLVAGDRLLAAERRIEAQPPVCGRAPALAHALNLWLPAGRRRILWIAHVETVATAMEPVAAAARRGLGEARPIGDVPGMLFDAVPDGADDPVMLPAAAADALSLLAGLLVRVMAGEWDAWLLAEGSADRVEFWEGFILPRSAGPKRLHQAESLLSGHGCRIGFG